MSFQEPARYAGDLSVEDAYALLSDDKNAVLVDVRTQPEWAYVGVPDLSGLGKAPIFQEWQVYPAMHVVADFAPRLISIVGAQGLDFDAPVVSVPVRSALARRRRRADSRWMVALLQYQGRLRRRPRREA